MKEIYVVEIMNKKQVIINYGIDDGAKVKQKVRILERGATIYGKGHTSLGTLDSVKEELEITSTFPRFSVCEKIVYDVPIASALSGIILNSSNKESLDINVNEEQISNHFFPNITPIQLYDSVEIIK